MHDLGVEVAVLNVIQGHKPVKSIPKISRGWKTPKPSIILILKPDKDEGKIIGQ